MKTIQKTCPICGKEYLADAVRLSHGRETTCSRACSYMLRSQKITKKTSITCGVCGKIFELAPSQIDKKVHANFCSKDCHYKGRSLGITKRVVTKPYQYTEASKKALIESAKKPKGKRSFHMLTCTHCGIEFNDPNYGRKRKSNIAFCSLNCCNAYRCGENNPAWRGGYDKYYGKDWKPLRKETRIRDNYTCQRCGLVCRKPNRLPDVHHIIPVSSFDIKNDANKLNNLVCLCHSCHMFVADCCCSIYVA